MKNTVKKGFTLIELLVVILILGILVAVALPAYLSSIKDARTKTANTNARAIATAVQAKYVQAGGTDYTGIATNVNLNADMGGAVPTNPCNGLNGLAVAGTGYTAVILGGGTGVTITAVTTANCNATTGFTLGS